MILAKSYNQMDIPNGLKLRHLEAFLTVAQAGTISAAARQRNVSQPALSKTISELEGLLGAHLFERTGRRAVLTPAGENFRAHARAALQSLEAGVRDLSGQVAAGLKWLEGPEATEKTAPGEGVRRSHRPLPGSGGERRDRNRRRRIAVY